MEIVLNDPQVAHVFAASHEAEAKESNSEEVDKQFKPPMKMKIICSYLYFIQGVALALPATMPLMYPELPPYWILSIFSAATLPFSFKFIEGTSAKTQRPSLRSSPASVMARGRRG